MFNDLVILLTEKRSLWNIKLNKHELPNASKAVPRVQDQRITKVTSNFSSNYVFEHFIEYRYQANGLPLVCKDCYRYWINQPSSQFISHAMDPSASKEVLLSMTKCTWSHLVEEWRVHVGSCINNALLFTTAVR